MIGDTITTYPSAFRVLAKTLMIVLLPKIRQEISGRFPRSPEEDASLGSGFHYSLSHTSGVERAQTDRSIPNASPKHIKNLDMKNKPSSYGKYCIAIGGESGCGKSTLAHALQNAIKEVSALEGYIFHTDDYFKRPPKDNHNTRLKDIKTVGPQELDFSSLDKNISTLKRGNQTLQKPIIDYFGNAKKTEIIDSTPFSYCIVEGTYACLSTQAQCKLFMESNYKDTEKHRKKRNRDPISNFNDTVLAIEHEIIKEHIDLADIIIDKNLTIKNHSIK